MATLSAKSYKPTLFVGETFCFSPELCGTKNGVLKETVEQSIKFNWSLLPPLFVVLFVVSQLVDHPQKLEPLTVRTTKLKKPAIETCYI